MASIDTERVIELAQDMVVLQERISTLRLDLFSQSGLHIEYGMNYLGGEGAPWVAEVKSNWNSVVSSRSAEAAEVYDILEKIRMNLLYSAAAQMQSDGESADNFADTSISLEEHASGEHFEEW